MTTVGKNHICSENYAVLMYSSFNSSDLVLKVWHKRLHFGKNILFLTCSIPFHLHKGLIMTKNGSTIYISKK